MTLKKEGAFVVETKTEEVEIRHNKAMVESKIASLKEEIAKYEEILAEF